jgi:MSHA biogenesis protein MshI
MHFFKNKKEGGWAAFKTLNGNIQFAHVEHQEGSKPVIKAWVDQALNLQSAPAVEAFVHNYGLDLKHCIAVLNRAEYQLLQIDAIDVPAAELKQAVRWSIKDIIDFPVEDATVDVLGLPDSAIGSRKHFMFAVVARNQVIQERILIFLDNASAGLEVIDIPETSQRNIAAMLERPNLGLALISFSEEGTLLTITAGGELYQSRQADITDTQLQDSNKEKRDALFDSLVLEIQRTLDNFERQFSQIVVNRLVVAPFEGRDALVKFFKKNLSLEVETFELSDVFNLDQVPQLVDLALQSRIFTVVGAALREDA